MTNALAHVGKARPRVVGTMMLERTAWPPYRRYVQLKGLQCSAILLPKRLSLWTR